jgi:hypothetical protein
VILLWGVPNDGPLAAVGRVLQLRGVPHIFIDQFGLLETHLSMPVTSGAAGQLYMPETSVDLANIGAAYIRPYDSLRVLRILGHSDEVACAHAASVEGALLLWCELTEVLVVNRPSTMTSNNSKPWQSEFIAQTGFAVPETLLTNDPAEAAAFRDSCGDVVYKSISGVRSRVSVLLEQDLERVAGAACPVQFQRHVSGTDVRVHVVGNEVFACEIWSSADDYRYPAAPEQVPRLAACSLPKDVERRCLSLARRLGLVVTGIDLRRDEHNVWWCFEANPSPGFTYYESETGLPIAQALANLLLKYDQSGSAPEP